MRRTVLTIAAILLALGAVEGFAYWWMHPKPAGQGEPVLAYRPSRSAGVSPAAHKPRASDQTETNVPAQSSTSTFNVRSSKFDVPSFPSSTSDLRPSTFDSSSSTSSLSTLNSQLSTSSITPLPELYAKSAPMLRCSGGQVLHVKLDNTLGLHLAFFEWDNTDTGSVLEAFRHMPEACMGAIGMELISKEKPISYAIDGQTLVFDHTIFREPGQGGGLFSPGPLVHAFRAVWVAGLSLADARRGLGGNEFDRLRTIRLKSALTRFRPTRARVIQGAVRGAPNSPAAWQAFEQSMLADLKMEPR